MKDSGKIFVVFLALILRAELAEAKLVKQRVKHQSQSPQSRLSLDEFYRIKKVFLFPGQDDIRGSIATHLDQKLLSLLGKNPRFEILQDKEVIKALGAENEDYKKVTGSEAVHKEAVRITGADATIFIKTHNAAGKSQISLEWRDREGKFLINEVDSVPSGSSIEDQEELLEKLFNQAVIKIPFAGTVTGRTDKVVTIDLGDGQVEVGDQVNIARIISLQRHPYLQTMVKADYMSVGVAKITNVDRLLSFAEITEENNNEFIGANNKVIGFKRVEKKAVEGPKPVEMATQKEIKKSSPWKPNRNDSEGFAEAKPKDETLHGDFERPMARLGMLGAGLAYGSISHSNTSGSSPTTLSGSGLGAKVIGELWVTKEWILGGDYVTHSAKLGSVGSSSWNRLTVWGGYKYLPDENPNGTAVVFGGGYQIKNSNIPTNSSLGTESKQYSGFVIKVDGDIAIDMRNRILAGVSISPFNSADGMKDISTLGFRAGWSTLIQGTLWGRLNFDYDSSTGTTSGSATRSDKRYALEPTLLFYF